VSEASISREVMSDNTIVSNQGKSLCADHHRRLDQQSKSLTQFSITIGKEADSRICTTTGSTPCLHNECIICSDTDSELNTLSFQFLLGCNERWQVRFTAARRESTGHGKDGNFLSGDKLGNQPPASRNQLVPLRELQQGSCLRLSLRWPCLMQWMIGRSLWVEVRKLYRRQQERKVRCYATLLRDVMV